LVGCNTEHRLELNDSKESHSEDAPKTGSVSPQNVDQAIARLLQMMSRDEIKKVKEEREADMVEYHFTIGLWIRNNWLAKGSSLRSFFIQRGLYDRDKMSGIILVSFWRSVHGLPIKVDDQIAQSKTELNSTRQP